MPLIFFGSNGIGLTSKLFGLTAGVAGAGVCAAASAGHIAAVTAAPAVMPASAPESGLLSRKRSIKGAPSPIQSQHGTKVVQVARRPPKVPASNGGKEPGSR